MKKTPTAAVIVIGNEVLSGKVEESNAGFFSKKLWELGVSLKTIHTIPDDITEIADTVRRCMPRYTYVFTTGGVGPTHDDITMEGIARAVGVKLTRNKRIAEIIQNHYKERTNDHLLKMADLPEGSELVTGSDFFFPMVKIQNVYIFPGDPTLLQRKFLSVQEMFRAKSFFIKKIWTWLDEGELAELLKTTEQQYPGLSIGSYPLYNRSDYRVLITFEGADEDIVQKGFHAVHAKIQKEKIVREE